MSDYAQYPTTATIPDALNLLFSQVPKVPNTTYRMTGAVFKSLVVRTSEDQTIAGVKTFSSTIIANISGNAATVTNLSLANSFTTSGNFAVTQTYTGATNVTFPTSGTLATTANLGSYLPLAGGTLTGNLAFNGAALRLLGDFSNAGHVNRLLLKSSTTNGETNVGAVPNGTGTFASYIVYDTVDPDNAASFQMFADHTNSLVGFNTSSRGSGVTKSITFQFNGTTALSINSSTVINIPFLSASQVVVTDASKNLASLAYASANTVSALVQRDGSGNIAFTTATGNLTGNASGSSGSCTGNAATATSATTATNTTNIAITDDTTTNATMYLTWVTANTGNLPQKTTSTKLSFNPSTGALTATSFVGTISGNAATATALQNSRSVYGNSFNGTADLTQVIASSFGGTGNGFAKLSGPNTSEKTFTLPNVSATILTSNDVVTVGQGGTGLTSTTANQLLYSSATSVIGGLASANNSILATNGSGVPALAGALPSAVMTTGTWSPTIGDGTNNFTGGSTTGSYTKINFGTETLYICSIYAAWTGKGTASGVIRVSLPATLSDLNAQASMGYMAGISFLQQLTIEAEGFTNYVTFYDLGAAGAAPTNLANTAFGTSGQIRISCQFWT